MTVHPIYIIPHPVLKQKAAAIEKIDSGVLTLIDDMAESMYAARGIGLAAPQIGVSRRVVVMNIDRDADKNIDGALMHFINPEIIWSSEEPNIYDEGCLSIPDQYAEIERPKQVRVRYQDRTGATLEIEADGLLATCLQHEIDHLNGILFVDHLSSLKRDMIVRKVKKWAKENADTIGKTHIL
jgi:peptide deformylase